MKQDCCCYIVKMVRILECLKQLFPAEFNHESVRYRHAHPRYGGSSFRRAWLRRNVATYHYQQGAGQPGGSELPLWLEESVDSGGILTLPRSLHGAFSPRPG